MASESPTILREASEGPPSGSDRNRTDLPSGALQILRPDGTLLPGSEVPLTDAQAVEAYRWMSMSKAVDERAFTMQRQGRLGTFSPTRGQEASVVGSALALTVGKDWVVPQYRELGAVLMHGLPLEQWFCYWMGNMTGGWIPESVRVLPVQIALAAQIPHAVGLAWGRRLLGTDETTIVYFGDGASSEGDFHEAANFAGVVDAPVILFLQNNGWAISTPRSRQSAAKTLASRAEGYGMPGVIVDGNDVMAVYAATRDAVARARRGEGPTLIESMTYRLGPHNTADDHTRYVDADDFEASKALDPLPRMYSYLLSAGLWDERRESELAEELTKLAQDAAEAAEKRRPQARQVFDHVYATPPSRLIRQAENLLGPNVFPTS